MNGRAQNGGSDNGRGPRLVPGLAVRAGQTVAGKYRVEELIGAGASGIVISARNIHVREPVILKLLASYTDGQEELVQRRLAKARVAARLQGKHAARIVDIGTTEDRMPYVATEFLEGRTLQAELEERGPLPVVEAVQWVLQACEGLAEAHACGLIHGDLKPQNIFLAEPPPSSRSPQARPSEDANEDRRVLKILDFGTTSPLDGIADQSASAFFGSPAFLAPEQIQDAPSVDARADVWALGVVLYNLVSGKLPFSADTVSGVIVSVVYDAPSLLTEAPYDLSKIVARCLQKDPVRRPQSVAELASELAPFGGIAGPRLAGRVRAMLEMPPPVTHAPAFDDEQASGSIGPLAVSLSGPEPAPPSPAPPSSDGHAPLPLVRRAPSPSSAADARTRPSKRVIARRRSRLRSAAGLLAAAASVALASWGATRAGLFTRSAASVDDPSASTTTLTSEQLEVPAFVPTTAPMATAANAIAPVSTAPVSTAPVAIAAVSELPDAPAVSFAASERQPMIPTPLVVEPTPLAGGGTFAGPPRAPSTVGAPPRAGSAPSPARAPASSPRHRDRGDRARPAPASPAPAAAPRSQPGARGDGTYLRDIFTERK